MRQRQTTLAHDVYETRDGYTFRGLAVSLVVFPVFLALLVAPGVVLGVLLGPVVVKLVGRLQIQRGPRRPQSVTSSPT